MGNTDKFEMMAQRYDNPERIKIGKIIAEEIREYVVDGKEKSAMDFGCGTGLVGMNLIDEFQSMLFLDTSPNMLEVVQDKINKNNFSNARTLCVDFETTEQPKLQLDYIFMAQVLLHIPDYQAVLTKLFEILIPGGKLIIVDFDKNKQIHSDIVHNGFNQGDLTEVLKESGFQIISSKTFYKEEKLFMNQDASMFVMSAQK